jgi:hypothetical protein
LGNPQDENILAKACLRMWSGEFVVRDSLDPKETVVVEGVFLVPRENENDVTLRDYGVVSLSGRSLKPLENRKSSFRIWCTWRRECRKDYRTGTTTKMGKQ